MKIETSTWNGRLLIGAALLFILAADASATAYLGGITDVICTMVGSFKTIGNSLAVVMFVYGAVRYVYSSDDPGGRKQAQSICIACIIALIIIQAADGIIGGIGGSIAGASNPC